MLISLQNISKHFGEKVILENVNAIISKLDRIGIIGENGAGKTTLLKIICGEYEADSGEFFISQNVRLGYLEQNSALHPELSLYEEMEQAFLPVLHAMEEMKSIEKQLQLHPSDHDLLQKHDALWLLCKLLMGIIWMFRLKRF